jgi:hypothetical protein
MEEKLHLFYTSGLDSSNHVHVPSVLPPLSGSISTYKLYRRMGRIQNLSGYDGGTNVHFPAGNLVPIFQLVENHINCRNLLALLS